MSNSATILFEHNLPKSVINQLMEKIIRLNFYKLDSKVLQDQEISQIEISGDHIDGDADMLVEKYINEIKVSLRLFKIDPIVVHY